MTERIRPRDPSFDSPIDDACIEPECIGFDTGSVDPQLTHPSPPPGLDADIAEAARNLGWSAHEPMLEGHVYDMRTMKGVADLQHRLYVAGMPRAAAAAIAEKIASAPAALHEALVHDALHVLAQRKSGPDAEAAFTRLADVRVALTRSGLDGSDRPVTPENAPLARRDSKALRDVAADPLVDRETRALAAESADRLESLARKAAPRPEDVTFE